MLPREVAAIRKIVDFCKANGFNKVEFGTGKKPSCNPKCPVISKRAPITIWPDGQIGIKLSWLDDTEAARAFRDKFQSNLRQAGLPHEYLPGQIIYMAINEWIEWVDQLLEAMRDATEQVLNPGFFHQSIHPDRLSRFGDSGDEIEHTWTITRPREQ